MFDAAAPDPLPMRLPRVESALNAVRMSNHRDRLSAGLDPRARRTLINLLRELPITMLVSTHDMKLVEELFPRTIVMDEGVIVADGKTKDILADAKLFEAHGLEKPQM